MTEEAVTFAAAVAATQAIWPATKSNNISLADGSRAVSPLNGYQYVRGKYRRFKTICA